VVGTLVVLPDRCEVDLSDGELEAVLSHELAHVVRRDAGWLVLFAVLGRAMWVQPLNRLAREGFLEAADLECDDWSVARTRRPLELARSISRVAEWTLATGGARRGKALALGRGRRLSRRVSRILAGRRPARGPRWIRFAAAAVVLAPTLLLPAVPLAGARQAVVVRVEVTRGAPVAGVEDGETRTVSLRRIRRP
jgi:beta-lactamase regulating signal transducer with metallopeptidase domain